jgi:hypothetical protein
MIPTPLYQPNNFSRQPAGAPTPIERTASRADNRSALQTLSGSSADQFEARLGTIVPATNKCSFNLARLRVTAP